MIPRDKIEAAAEQFGWDDTKLDPHWIQYVKAVPMIGQRDEYRVVVLYNEAGRVMQAYYGPDRRPTALPAPLVNSVVEHLVKWGPHQ